MRKFVHELNKTGMTTSLPSILPLLQFRVGSLLMYHYRVHVPSQRGRDVAFSKLTLSKCGIWTFERCFGRIIDEQLYI